jgi:GNAT superfamily N-acetyltransferase
MTETIIASRTVGGRRYQIDTDPTRLDIALVHHLLAECSHWARDIPLDTLRRAIAHSMPFGLYRDGRQIGFARIVTDQATFAYLADVFVVAEERNAGLGQWLIETILAHPPLQGLRRWLLVTKNAKSLYLRCGFAELSPDVSYLERFDPAVYAFEGGSCGSDHHDPASDGGRGRRARRTPEFAGPAWAH